MTTVLTNIAIPQRMIRKYTQANNSARVTKTDTIDFISPESPLEIRVRSSSENISRIISVTMRTIGQDDYLAIGFLFSEGIIIKKEEIISITFSNKNIIEVVVTKGLQDELTRIKRNNYTSSSCGICSKGNLQSIETHSSFLPWTSGFSIGAQKLFNLHTLFDQAQSIFNVTGGIHAATLLDSQANSIALFEDIGRHNAMDKLIGYCVINDLLPLSNYMILLSGRISFELVQKASMTGVPLVAALGAPSDLAIQEADDHNICLVGFAKNSSFNIYSSFERVVE